ncbi:MAG: pirin family protein, partial [Myxococcota bacterium]
QKAYSVDSRTDQLRLVASQDGREGSVTVHQNVSLYSAFVKRGRSVSHELRPGRHAWLQLIAGELDLNGRTIAAGDGASVTDAKRLSIRSTADAHFLLFDLV